MESFARVVKMVLACGRHTMKQLIPSMALVATEEYHTSSVVFCSNYKIRRRYQQFSASKDKTSEPYAVDPDITKEIEMCVLTVESKPLMFVRTNGFYNCSPVNACLKRINMVEQAVHVWRNGKTTAENLELVDYRRSGFISSSFPGWTDTIDNIPRLTAREKVYGDRLKENNQPLLLRSEQKIEALIKTLVNKYTHPGDLVSTLLLNLIEQDAPVYCFQKILDVS